MKKYTWLLPMISFSTLLIALRVIYTSSFMFSFLIWNIFLAVLPLYFSYKARNTINKKSRLLYVGLWLLFFPNSMYIITDLFHLTQRPMVPLWYDLLLLFSSAITGMIAGMLSLHNIERVFVSNKYKVNHHVIIFLVMCLCAYGIYLGRFDRWNSWDIITQPYHLISNILFDITHPLSNKNVWALSMCFGTWMYMLYRYITKAKLFLNK